MMKTIKRNKKKRKMESKPNKMKKTPFSKQRQLFLFIIELESKKRK